VWGVDRWGSGLNPTAMDWGALEHKLLTLYTDAKFNQKLPLEREGKLRKIRKNYIKNLLITLGILTKPDALLFLNFEENMRKQIWDVGQGWTWYTG
jgi:hypothetical protein